MNFVAIDFETANPDLASICQIGVVKFQDSNISETWKTLVDPEDYFYPINVSIHGIDEEMVQDAPKFPEVFDHLKNILTEQIVVHHTHFDIVALNKAIEKYQLSRLDCKFLDTARVVRRTWSQFSWSGYGLDNVSKTLNIQFKHHVADEDARAAGEILLRAMNETGMNIEDWLIRVNKPIDPSKYSNRITRKGNPDGPLAGEILVFTGALSMPRREATDLAAVNGVRHN